MANQPLILTKTEITQIHRALLQMLKQSEAKCAMLVDADGKCLAKKGFTANIDTDALAALIAGSFASTRAMAKLVGETDFSVLFHQGERDHIHNILVDNNTILTVIFDDRTTIGMVRLYSKECSKSLKETISQARQKKIPVGKQIQIEKDVEDQLDNLFKED
ncbi:roadblock/LC7 domain-containing protein [Candidatus Sumerlaeota bacterium]|nr:roadblock/LC7 domain-containing protein [Candidatus Sumerlaeota bacterium]HMZ51371.1 roadblock/LC7 domain-containing protein [Candidatus Sumerlaeota bacterium]HNM47808.1 roadblock/LC7 domain-containing protein [Candidatus Sumerlaeota bacterium]